MNAGEALLATEPTVTIGDEKYQLKPLGLEAMAPLARLLKIAQTQTGVSLVEIASMAEDKEKVGDLFLAAMGWAEAEVLTLLGMLLGVTQAELRDPSRFSLGSIASMLAPLARQVDLAGFLSGRTAATSSEEKPATEQTEEPSDEPSGKSNVEPDGLTPNSEDSASLAG